MKDLLTSGAFFGILTKNAYAVAAYCDLEDKIMADNKQYITQIQDNGAVMISEDVICSIVSHAVSEVDGVVSINSKPAAELADMIGKKWGKGMKIAIADDNAITIDVDVIIGYGQSVVAIAGAVQTAIIGAVQSMTGVDAVSVNVNVCGISRQ